MKKMKKKETLQHGSSVRAVKGWTVEFKLLSIGLTQKQAWLMHCNKS